jgi:diaminopimelate decarboxylase
MSYEYSTDLQKIGLPIKEAFETFARIDGRKLKLEIEPGTYLVANSGALLCTVQDIVTTGESGYTFIKLDCGMTEVLRPSL